MINGKFERGDEVKFNGQVEPCIIYRVFDGTEVMMTTNFNGLLKFAVPKPHIHIEVMGLIATELLVPTVGHPNNVYAFEQLLKQSHRLT